jgi:hypothetical protein
MNDSDQCRERAKELREKAPLSIDQRMHDEMLAVADILDRLADKLDALREKKAKS